MIIRLDLTMYNKKRLYKRCCLKFYSTTQTFQDIVGGQASSPQVFFYIIKLASSAV